jgi:hypothetical protein
MSLTIKVDTSGADAVLIRARGAIGAKEALHKVAAASVSILVRGWLLSRNTRSITSNYWSKAAEATTHESDATSARVIIRHPGVGWHRYGGTIRAKPGKALAIPLQSAVKGMWPSEAFPNKGDAFIYRSKKGHVFLAAREGKALRIFYLLLKSVSKSADSTVLPDSATIASTAASSIRSFLSLQLSRQSAVS